MIGIDIISLNRIQKSLMRFGDRFLSRFLSQEEILLCKKENGEFIISRIAGFWATKEAISKALGTGIGEELGFLDILLFKDKKGKPYATLKKEKLKEFGLTSIAISITHDGDFAIAIAMLNHNFKI